MTDPEPDAEPDDGNDNAEDPESYRLLQAEELLISEGFVPVTQDDGSVRWVPVDNDGPSGDGT
jgi:hypothetical protein